MRLISPHTGIAMFYGIAERIEEAWNEGRQRAYTLREVETNLNPRIYLMY